MGRSNFFERMERELNLQHEYEKLDDIVLNEWVGQSTINDHISKHFSLWKDRRNFVSFEELRQHLGFSYDDNWTTNVEKIPTARITGVDTFLLYCEMMLNMFDSILLPYAPSLICRKVQSVIDTIMYDLEKLNHEVQALDDDRIIIVQKDASVTAVADIVEPVLADAIVEYNHHLLKGNIEKKKEILRKIADALEPKRSELEQINKSFTSDLFYLVNNMNIRHNNCDKQDMKTYNPAFDSLSDEEVEAWYDEIFQQELMAFLLLGQKERNARIDAFKKM